MKELPEFYNRVLEFNEKGNIKDAMYDSLEWWKQISLQTDLVAEEAEEGQEAAKYEDKLEILDATIDVLYLIFKQAAMLHKAGFDVVGAFDAVCKNNEDKIFNSYYEAVEAKEKLEERDDVEYFVDTSIYNGLPFYTIKNAKGKICKRVGFEPVDLSEFVPK